MVNIQKERFVEYIVTEGFGYLTGFDGNEAVCEGRQLTLVNNDDSKERVVVDNINTQVLDNPLNGFTEITIKIQARKEVL